MQSSGSESIDSCLVEFIDEALTSIAFNSDLYGPSPGETSSVDWFYQFED
jgi:hypothetical protein